MKTQIRFGTFETNSSSTHSLVILSEDEYKKYEDGEIMFDRDGEEVDSKEYDKCYDINLLKASKLFLANARECKYYRNASDMARDMTNEEFSMYNMEIEHRSRNINGVTVHALSIYGYDY